MYPIDKLYEMTSPNEKNYQPLTPIALAKSHYSKRNLRSFWNQIIHSLFSIFSPIREPIIEEITDRDGVTKWQVYDPAKDQEMIFSSPEEVHIWLEERR
ncbi:hypothetical protein C7B76_08945 [filamentous cyanobacterium CCP2]|nr:hypothetical protein C7B76_08945 [filamentous cyanobacterium CCP2]